MKEFNLKGVKRSAVGKKASREERKEGNIPCVVYGLKKDENGQTVATSFVAPMESLRKLIYSPDIFVVNLDIDGEQCKAVMREIQFHPVKDTVLHVDFYQITEGKPITMAVPIVFDGHAQGVRDGGEFYSMTRRLKVLANYEDIPEKLHVDITDLVIGKRINVGDLNFPKLQLVDPAQSLVCGVRTTRVVATTDTAAPEDGAAPAEGGEAPAGDAKEAPAKE